MFNLTLSKSTCSSKVDKMFGRKRGPSLDLKAVPAAAAGASAFFFCLLLLICYYFSCQQRSTSIHMWLHSVTVRGYWIGNTQSEKKYRTVQGCVGLFLLPQTAEGVNTDWAAGQTQTLLQTANRIASSIDFNWLPLQKVARLTGLNTLRYISQFFHH